LAALPKWRDEYDIVVMTEPELSWFRSSGPGVDIDIHQELYGNDPYALTSILSTRGFVKTNPEIARRFLKALRLAFQLANRAGAVEAASSATVKRAIAAVYRLSSSSYPTEYMVKEEAVGSMMAHLSKIRAFPDSILLDAEQRISLTRAYNLHFPHTVQAGALIDERIIDVTSDLDLMA
jgi:ABC-type nitrate/sulfonate/bicarbonate transport system substrate-binding protein